ncbi:MAG: hypothetical protein O3A00_04010 [Planctomycetota bacterium]|nr:hypothetical protein [Planctomycetota bacterium]
MPTNVMESGTRIVVESDGHHWRAWFADDPADWTVGSLPGLALKRVLAAKSERVPPAYKVRSDAARSTEYHLEFLIGPEFSESSGCPDCGGSGKYVGFSVIESCRRCDGSGIIAE